MATTDKVIIDLLIKNQGVLESVKNLKSFAAQVIDLTAIIDGFAAKYGLTFEKIFKIMDEYNARVASGKVQGVAIPTAPLAKVKQNFSESPKPTTSGGDVSEEEAIKRAIPALIELEKLRQRASEAKAKSLQTEIDQLALDDKRNQNSEDALGRLIVRANKENELFDLRKQNDIQALGALQDRANKENELFDIRKQKELDTRGRQQISAAKQMESEKQAEANRTSAARRLIELAKLADMEFERKKAKELSGDAQTIEIAKQNEAIRKKIATMEEKIFALREKSTKLKQDGNLTQALKVSERLYEVTLDRERLLQLADRSDLIPTKGIQSVEQIAAQIKSIKELQALKDKNTARMQSSGEGVAELKQKVLLQEYLNKLAEDEAKAAQQVADSLLPTAQDRRNQAQAEAQAQALITQQNKEQAALGKEMVAEKKQQMLLEMDLAPRSEAIKKLNLEELAAIDKRIQHEKDAQATLISYKNTLLGVEYARRDGMIKNMKDREVALADEIAKRKESLAKNLASAEFTVDTARQIMSDRRGLALAEQNLVLTQANILHFQALQAAQEAVIASTPSGSAIDTSINNNIETQKQLQEEKKRLIALAKEELSIIHEEALLENTRIDNAKRAEAELLKARSAVSSKTEQFNKIAENPNPANQARQLARVVYDLWKETGASTDQMLKLAEEIYNIDASTIKNATNQVHNLKNGLWGTIKELINVKSVVSTAFGNLTAMTIFQLQQVISKFFADSMQSAKDFANGMANLRVGEEILSSNGVKISGKEIMDVLDALDKKLSFVSKSELAKGLGSALNQLSNKKITADQAGKIVEVAAIIKLKSPEKDINEIVANITNGILTGTSEATKNIGLQFDDLRIKQKAKELGYIKSTTQQLTEQEKVQARIALTVEYANQKLGASLEQADKQTLALAEAEKSWKNIQLIIGQIMLVGLADAVRYAQDFVSVLENAAETLKKIATLMRYRSAVNKIEYRPVEGAGVAFVREATKEEKAKAWKDAMDAYYPSIQDTPTINNPAITDGAVDGSESNANKIKNSLKDLAEALDAFGDKARKMEEDFAMSMKKMAEDSKLTMDRFMEDWDISRSNIFNEFNIDRKKADDDYRQKELEDERQFQEQLRQLRESYLMNLEDALHERNARQVLRLAREYAMNKKNMINEHNLKVGSDRGNYEKEKKDAIARRDERLRLLDQENELKRKRMVEDFNIQQERAKIEHDIEMKRLEMEKQDKLRQVANSLSEQLKLTDDGTKLIYNLFDDYFGENGAVGKLVKYQYDNIVAYTQAMLDRLQEVADKYAIDVGTTPPPTTTKPPTNKSPRPKFRAKGGLDIVNSPTQVIMGEAGPEAHLYVPLNKISSLAGGLGMLGNNTPNPGGANMEILVELSKDLEARIIRKSVGSVENAIMKVRRQQ